MRITLDYGKVGLDVDLPEKNVVGPLELHPSEALANPSAELTAVLNDPIGSSPLRDLACGKKSVCILICDITRPVPNELLLRGILSTLAEAGLSRSDILILIATGLHRPNRGAEIIELVGREIADNYRIENHHGQNLDEHTCLGESARGVPVWIDTRYLNAELKIATGLIEPHLMAGYSGGRKLICPGIAALETVKVWHGPEFIAHPKADCGILAGNPVHDENTAIAEMAGCDFIVNVTLDQQRRITSIVAGDMQQAFLKGVEFIEKLVTVRVPQPCDVVVTSSAGYPLDTTFYQSIKGLTGVLPIVKSGGTIIIAAGLQEGIGSSDFQSLFKKHENLEAFTERIFDDDYFVLDQWQLQELAKVCRKAKVKYVSDGLPSEILQGLFVSVAPTVEAAVAESLEEYGDDARIAVIPKGPYVLPVVA